MIQNYVKAEVHKSKSGEENMKIMSDLVKKDRGE